MTILHSLLFGLVEGLTEFVPISSTAHMLFLQRLLGIPASDDMFSFLVIIQLGAIAALLVYFRNEFWLLITSLVARPFSTAENRQAWFIVFATIPALLAGFLLKDLVKGLFADPLAEAATRFLTAAAILAIAERLGRRNRPLASMTWLDAIFVGAFQVLAVFPGASRSGAAIGGGMLRNLDRSAATRFAFLMSAPVMLAAGAYETLGVLQRGGLVSLLPALPWGLLVAAASGWFSIRWLIGFVGRHRLYSFAAYCTVLGAACIAMRFI
jgi:undecaprenyl-diphosphatase